MNVPRSVVTFSVIAAAIAALIYLRDPPWLLRVAPGFGDWRTDASGVRYRPMAGRASFFIPAHAVSVSMPIRAPFESPVDWPIVATFSVDDRTVDRVVLDDDRWHIVTIPLLKSSRRRVRRIDIHADRTRSHNRGPHVGEPTLARR